ncbi:elongation factor Ts [Bacteroidia bacterium]|nr:elongation factor Ts [Bacteroidia bacterium]
MAEVTVKLISELREKTSAGMMDCKNALTETGGDIQAAADWLRQKGIVKAAKKADRVAAAGLVSTAVSADGKLGVVVEVNAETDFVAKNDKFQKLVGEVVAKAVEIFGGCECKCACECESKCFAKINEAMSDEVKNLIATIGENMNIRRASAVGGDAVYTYIHNALVPGMGQIGVIVAINGDAAKTAEIGQKVAMHIAANKPEFMTVADVDPAAVEREKKIFIDSGKTAGKPEQVVEKMITGRIAAYYGESVLEEQPFVMDPSKTVKQIVAEAGGQLAGFAYFLLGEGIEKREDNLADEVSKMLK